MDQGLAQSAGYSGYWAQDEAIAAAERGGAAVPGAQGRHGSGRAECQCYLQIVNSEQSKSCKAGFQRKRLLSLSTHLSALSSNAQLLARTWAFARSDDPPSYFVLHFIYVYLQL